MNRYRLYDADDRIHGCDDSPADRVVDFWRWAFGNLNEDTLKGLFAEWLIGRILGLDLQLGGRNGGTNSDLFLDDGTRVEVKSTAYWQSWKLYTENGRPLKNEEIDHRHWERLKKPLRFNVKRTQDAVDRTGTEKQLWSDIYVFAAQHEKDPEAWDILDMRQWRFYCLTQEEVLALPQSFAEDRLFQFCPALTAAELSIRARAMMENLQEDRIGHAAPFPASRVDASSSLASLPDV